MQFNTVLLFVVSIYQSLDRSASDQFHNFLAELILVYFPWLPPGLDGWAAHFGL